MTDMLRVDEDPCGSYKAEIERLHTANVDMLAALQLARSMFLDMERGISPSRIDFTKITSAIAKAMKPRHGTIDGTIDGTVDHNSTAS